MKTKGSFVCLTLHCEFSLYSLTYAAAVWFK